MRKPKYRFFFHWNKIKKRISVHYRDKCMLTDGLSVKVSMESKFNKTQPVFVMQGWATHIKHTNKLTIIS
jgi:hypothetical protein